MAAGGGTTNMKQLATMEQKQTIHISRIPLASKKPKDQSEDHEEALQLPEHHRDTSTSTAYFEDTNIMEVTYAHPRHTHQEPLYTASKLAPALDALTTHTVEGNLEPAFQPRAPNPFSLPSSALPTWDHARTTLSNPTYFYTTLLNNLPLLSEPAPEPEERFEVRTLECTTEIEQGLADLRALLRECQRAENAMALEGLRLRVRGVLRAGGVVRE